MASCPRCGADAISIRQDVTAPGPDGHLVPQAAVTGWVCDNEHSLAEREVVEDEPILTDEELAEVEADLFDSIRSLRAVDGMPRPGE